MHTYARVLLPCTVHTYALSQNEAANDVTKTKDTMSITRNLMYNDLGAKKEKADDAAREAADGA